VVGATVGPRYVLIVSDPDPVAHRVAERWGTPPSTGLFVEGAAVRALSASAYFLRRPGVHIHDEGLDLKLPAALRDPALPLVFPSIHRSEQNQPCLTVHPLGNPGSSAEVGGSPRTLVPTDPGLMAAALRALDERSSAAGVPASYESTHHGPALRVPGLFVEIGYGSLPSPPESAVAVLAEVLRDLETAGDDRVALAVGGGHYAPHFTDLALRRRWAFGHILSRHALTSIDVATARSAYELTPRAEGIVYARAADRDLPALAGLGPRRRDSEAPERRPRPGAATAGGPPASGT